MAVLEEGQINIHTENIFPIIKKAVYSDHEIFIRELVSNSVDAISKRRMAAISGDCIEGNKGSININGYKINVMSDLNTDLCIGDKCKVETIHGENFLVLPENGIREFFIEAPNFLSLINLDKSP